MPSPLDHFLILFFVVLLPVYNWVEARKAKAQIAAGKSPDEFDTVGDYRKGVATLWAIGVAALVIWLVQSRTTEALGLGVGDGGALRWAAALALAILGLGLTYWQAAQLSSSGEARKKLHDQLGDLVHFLPKTRRELFWFRWLSFSAGVCEEILFRGFLMWYVAAYLGVLPAILLSTVAFGAAHSYQGLSSASQTAIIGLWMAILYWLTGSLWLPMLAHFLVDAIGGRMIHAVLSREDPPVASEGQALSSGG